MKEIRADCSTSRAVQIELPLDISPAIEHAIEQIYTPNPRWDSLGVIQDPYWDEVEEQLTQPDDSCDILDQLPSCSAIGTTDGHNLGNFNSAHEHLYIVREHSFIADEQDITVDQQYASVREQVTFTTNSRISESSVREQVKDNTLAHEHESPTHWIEKYWVSRRGNKYWYYRYTWMAGRKMHRIHIGSVRSPKAQRKVEVVRAAIVQGLPPNEIKQLINGYHE